MGEYSSTGINYLTRRTKSGIYYWQAKIDGRVKRGSLKTTNKTEARLRLPIELGKAKALARSSIDLQQHERLMVKFWFEQWLKEQEARPELKERTKSDYAQRVNWILDRLDLTAAKVDQDKISAFWQKTCSEMSPQRANGALRIIKQVFATMHEKGVIPHDFSKKLNRMPEGRKIRSLPSKDQFRAITISIRSQERRSSYETADFVEFLAFTGLRISEARAVRWEDISESGILVTSSKNRHQRIVPILRPLKPFIDRARGNGPVFTLHSPVRALTNACRRLETPHLRVHDLRHLFATTCIESGVDIPTVAQWLGHQDGGALAMKTYAHVRTDHGMTQAAKVNF